METKFSLDLDQIPKELKLIFEFIKIDDIECLQTKINEGYKDIDWNVFLELTQHHRVYTLLSAKLKRIEEGIIPPIVIQTINKLYMVNTFRMLHFSGEMEQLNKIFNQNKVRLLVLKGPILGAELYGDVSLRTSGDLDVLVPLQDLDKVDKILINLGYEKDDYIQTILNDWTWRHHHVTYFNHKKNIKIEIHWRLNPGPGKEPSFNELWSRKRVTQITKLPIFYLGMEDLFLFLVSHGARHGWSRIRWLVDINQLVGKTVNWPLLITLLKKYQYIHLGGQALVLTAELLNTPITVEMRTLIKGENPKRLAQEAIFYLKRMINLHNYPVPRDVAGYHKRHLFNLMSFRQKILFVLSLFYPYPEDAKTLPLPTNFHFFYFLLRPFLWAWRKTRNHVVS